MSLNRYQFIGRLVTDPELRYTPDGTPVLNFRVAVNEPYQDRETEEWKDRTTWLRCIMWDKAAEGIGQSERYHSGDLIYAEGRPRTSAYLGKDKESGEEKALATLEVNVARIQLLKQKTEAKSDLRGAKEDTAEEPIF